MAELKVDVTSKVVEKGIDVAKSFLGKLIVPSIEEAGLLLKDKITHWRLKNQVRILNKTQEYCIKHNISPKSISLKLLCPLLENASLEEDEYLQDKWAILLGNLVDSEQNIENHVFPFLLSQISKREFQELEESKIKYDEHVREITSELEKSKEPGIGVPSRKTEFNLSGFRQYEFSNLKRLGLVDCETIHSIPDMKYDLEFYSKGLKSNGINVHLDKNEEYFITELGILFVQACNGKSNSEIIPQIFL